MHLRKNSWLDPVFYNQWDDCCEGKGPKYNTKYGYNMINKILFSMIGLDEREIAHGNEKLVRIFEDVSRLADLEYEKMMIQ